MATATTDAALRLYLRRKLKNRPLRLQAVLGTVEYSMLAPLLALGGMIVSLIVVSSAYDPPGFDVSGTGTPGFVLGLAAAIGLAAVGPLPPVALIQSGLKPLRRAPSSKTNFAIRWARGSIKLWLLLFLAVCIAMLPQIVRAIARFPMIERRQLGEIVGGSETHCNLAGPQPTVDAILQSDARSPLLLYPRNVSAEVQNFQRHRDRYVRFAPRDMDAEPILLMPGVISAHRFNLKPVEGYSPLPDDHCFLTIEGEYQGY